MIEVKKETLTISVQNQQNEKTEIKKNKPSKGVHAEKKARQGQAVDWLTQAFPQCFNVREPKPLKLKIEKDILNQWVYLSSLPYDLSMPSRALLRRAVGWYATRSGYYAAFDKATHRIDLEGKEAGEITEGEKAYARERLTVMKVFYKQHRKNKQKVLSVKQEKVSQTCASRLCRTL